MNMLEGPTYYAPSCRCRGQRNDGVNLYAHYRAVAVDDDNALSAVIDKTI